MNTMSPSNTGDADTAESASHSVVQRIATATDRSIADLPPLYETIDPDALNELVASVDTERTAFTLTFNYVGHRVTVTGNGAVHVEGTEHE